MIFMNLGYTDDCTYIVEKEFLYEDILTFYLDHFDSNSSQSQLNLFKYKIKRIGINCSDEILIIEYLFKIYAPEIGLTRYETFYKGKAEIAINSEIQYFNNSDFTFVSGPTVINNPQAEKIISYIGM